MGAREKKNTTAGDKRSYEECRRERVEENKKRLQQLNLGALIKAKVLRKQTDPSSVPIRRSSRDAPLPPPNYKEILDIDPSERLRRVPTKYLIEKNGLSGGWRGFAIAHDLVDGDALVFQLIKPLVFKMYVVRAYIQEEDEEEEAEVKGKKEKAPDVSHLDRNTKRVRASNPP